MNYLLGSILLAHCTSFREDDANAALVWMSNQRVAEARVSPLKAFALSEAQLGKLDDAVANAVIQPSYDFIAGKYTIQSLADELRKTSLQVLGELGITSNPSLVQRVEASAISSWVRTHIVYNEALPSGDVPNDVQALYWTSSTLLKQRHPWAVCAGYSRLTLDLSAALNLPCYDVLGVLRDPRNSIPPKWTHSWNIYVFRGIDGKLLATPCDNTISRISLNQARSLNGRIHHLDCFPNTSEEWGYFLWRQRCTANDGDKPIPEECALDKMTEQEWRRLELPVLEQFISQVEHFEPGATVRVNPVSGN